MDKQFRDVEATFNELKRQFRFGEISQREFIDRLKQLRIKDPNGRFWMIGAQSGRWYVFEGKDWVKAEPPSFEEKKLICIYCGFENDLEAESCARCGNHVTEGEDSEEASGWGPGENVAGPGEGPSGHLPAAGADVPDEDGVLLYAVHSIRPGSFMIFSGTIGIFTGVLLGLILGATGFLPEFVALLPAFLQEMQGKLLGAIILTLLGGIAGFICFAGFGLLCVGMANGALSLAGGVQLRLEKRSGGPLADKSAH
ncbi:MAG TPA: hypothetical protein PLX50_02305 [Candidatus Aminicenantes bacterium]|nr:hypothetical protein [Candidatus Aminicenantes bacterium]